MIEVDEHERHRAAAGARLHGSEPSGRPVGFVIEFADGRSVYHQGDTWIFGDMALIQEFYHPTIILMNAGGKVYGQRRKWG